MELETTGIESFRSADVGKVFSFALSCAISWPEPPEEAGRALLPSFPVFSELGDACGKKADAITVGDKRFQICRRDFIAWETLNSPALLGRTGLLFSHLLSNIVPPGPVELSLFTLPCKKLHL